MPAPQPGLMSRIQKSLGDISGKLNNKAKGGGFGDKIQNVARAAEGDPIAIGKLAIDDIKNKYNATMGFGKGMADAATTRSPFAAAEKGIKANTTLAAAWDPTGISKIAKPVIDFGAQLIGSVDKLKTWNDSLQKANFQFAEFSGAMTRVQVGAQLRQIALEQNKGDQLAASAGRQSEASGRFNQSISPIENLWGKFQNDLTATLTNIADKIISPVGKVAETANNIYDWISGDDNKKPDEIDLEDFLIGNEKPHPAELRAKPKRFADPFG